MMILPAVAHGQLRNDLWIWYIPQELSFLLVPHHGPLPLLPLLHDCQLGVIFRGRVSILFLCRCKLSVHSWNVRKELKCYLLRCNQDRLGVLVSLLEGNQSTAIGLLYTLQQSNVDANIVHVVSTELHTLQEAVKHIPTLHHVFLDVGLTALGQNLG